VKRLVIIAFAAFVSLSSAAQTRRTAKEQKRKERQDRINALIKQEEEGALIFSKQNIWGLQLRTNGYGFFYEHGVMKTRRKTVLYSFEFDEIKSSKEQKSSAGLFSFSNPYIFGKQNYFYPIKLGYGQQYLLGQKGNKNGVAVTAVYSAGLSVGLLRPYYLQVDDGSSIKTIKYSKQDSSIFVDRVAIQGGGGLGKGWGEIKPKFGAFAKGAIRFDYGRYNELVSGVEIGISIEAYSDKIPIMIAGKQQQLFFQGHLALVLGRRK
jgi:hypothetical protein